MPRWPTRSTTLYMASARVFVSMNALDQVLWIDEPVTMQNKHTPNESLCRYVAAPVSFIIRLPIMSRKLKGCLSLRQKP